MTIGSPRGCVGYQMLSPLRLRCSHTRTDIKNHTGITSLGLGIGETITLVAARGLER